MQIRVQSLLSLSITLLLAYSQAEFLCGPGEYVSLQESTGTWECAKCKPAGTFYQDKVSHSDTECKRCQQADPSVYEYEAQACTLTQNTVILCDEEHFRIDDKENPRRAYCQSCRVCGVGEDESKPFEESPCGNYSDTVCTAGTFKETTTNPSPKTVATTSIADQPAVSKNGSSTNTTDQVSNASGPNVDLEIVIPVVVFCALVCVVVAIFFYLRYRKRASKGNGYAPAGIIADTRL